MRAPVVTFLPITEVLSNYVENLSALGVVKPVERATKNVLCLRLLQALVLAESLSVDAQWHRADDAVY